jgi:hypothetical protein
MKTVENAAKRSSLTEQSRTRGFLMLKSNGADAAHVTTL